ncbi:MAG: nucleotidyltransferase domain-containing protein [Deltaproteobacteria bacterium]|nr:nucleotidyltransferase domain-containing protein [Deltaproteobacteria bacterium]
MLAADRAVRFGYLFGSWAEGRMRPRSDVDVAVWLKEDAPKPFEVRLGLIGRLEVSLKRPVEVIVLNEAPLILRYTVVQQGIPIYTLDDRERAWFEVQARKAYWDFEPRLRVYAEFMQRRLREGRFGT